MKRYNFLIFIPFILILFFININITFWNSCKYESEINECNAANKPDSSIWPKWIDSFVCIVWSEEDVAYQVVLDHEFKEIDKEMDDYIENLEKNKNLYFWKDKKRTYIDWINDIHKNSTYFYDKYKKVCWNNLIEQVISCMPDWKTSEQNAKKFFGQENSLCDILVNRKMEIYDNVAFWVLMLNKEQIKADQKKLYDQWQRNNYDRLLDIMMINLWYIERIWQKTPYFLSKIHK